MDKNKLELARKIHGSDLAGPDSFSAEQMKGVERAWAWVCENTAPKPDIAPTCAHGEPRQYDAETREWFYQCGGTGDFNRPPQDQQMKQERTWHEITDMDKLRADAKAREPYTGPREKPYMMVGGWTDEQREAARGIWMAHATGTLTFNAVLEAISHVAPLFVEQRAVPMAERALHTAHEFTPHGINLSATCGTQGQIDAIPWSDILRHAPKRAVPSIEACVEAFESLCYDHESKRDRRAGVESVRALCIGEQGDGASVPGDSGLKAGHNMERGSGCPASDHHADRETSTPQGPKDPAPSPAPAAPTFEPWTVDDPHATEIYQDEKILRYKNGNGRVVFFNKEAFKFLRDTSPAERANADMPFTRTGVDAPAPFAPDREALSRLFYKTWRQRPPGVGFNARELADAYIDYFAPLLAERDALQAEVEKLRRKNEANLAHWREDIEDYVKQRDTALARVRELEEASKIASDVYAAAQKVGEHLARTTGVVLAGKTYDHAVNAALDRIKELEGAGIDVEACIREVRETPWTFAVQQRHRDEIVLSIASILRKHARPAKRSVTREELATIVYNYEISEKPMTAALASVGIEVKP